MPTSKITYQQQAYQYIKDQITHHGFKPGEYITDAKIARILNISRTPVREAFHRLENEMLLVYEAHHGWKVYRLTLDDIHEIFDLKVLVEGMVARQAAACQDETLREKLRITHKQMVEMAESGDVDNWIQSDVRFHNTLYEMAHNERARRLIQNLNDQWNRLRIGFTTIQGRVYRSNDEHYRVLECILAGDGDEAERCMQQHLNQLRQELVSVLINIVLPFAREGV